MKDGGMRRDGTRAGTSRMPARSFLFQTKVLRSTSKEVFPAAGLPAQTGQGMDESATSGSLVCIHPIVTHPHAFLRSPASSFGNVQVGQRWLRRRSRRAGRIRYHTIVDAFPAERPGVRSTQNGHVRNGMYGLARSGRDSARNELLRDWGSTTVLIRER